MKLRFEADQAECFRNGINCEKSIVTVEVDPARLPQEQRNLIADRLNGIDVVLLDTNREKRFKLNEIFNGEMRPFFVMAKAPTFESLLEAVRENEQWIVGKEPEMVLSSVDQPCASVVMDGA